MCHQKRKRKKWVTLFTLACSHGPHSQVLSPFALIARGSFALGASKGKLRMRSLPGTPASGFRSQVCTGACLAGRNAPRASAGGCVHRSIHCRGWKETQRATLALRLSRRAKRGRGFFFTSSGHIGGGEDRAGLPRTIGLTGCSCLQASRLASFLFFSFFFFTTARPRSGAYYYHGACNAAH